MKIAVMQPYFLPYIGYFQLINLVDKFVILDDVQFINKGWINRNYILQKNKPLLFTIPVSKMNSKSLISETKVFYDSGKISKFLKSVKLNYSSSPFFKEVFYLLENIFRKKYSGISGLALSGLYSVNDYLNINTNIIKSSSVYKNQQLKGEERIIDICRQEGADEYYNLSGGVDIYSKEKFESENIKLKFIKTKEIRYKQFENEFTGPLSIIDNLMFYSPEEVKKSLLEFEIL